MKNLLIFFLALTFYSGCKKYPEGPLLSLRTKEHRIIGTWDVEYFSINGYDSTAYLKSNPFYGRYEFTKGGNGYGDFIYLTNDNSYRLSGGWGLSNNKKNIETNLFLDGISYNLGPYAADYVVWEIRRLKEKELWLKTTFNGKEYFVKFKQ